MLSAWLSQLRPLLASVGASVVLIVLVIGVRMPFLFSIILASIIGIALWLLLPAIAKSAEPRLSDEEQKKQDIAIATQCANNYINSFGTLQQLCRVESITQNIADIITIMRKIRVTFSENTERLVKDATDFEEYARSAHAIVENYIRLSDLRDQEACIKQAEQLIEQLPALFEDLYMQRREHALIELEVHSAILQEMAQLNIKGS
ncbi:MAG: 5-bromo-4-chloroindolyl phosphate hydrolysis family protein [Mariprofundales bacterium]